MDRQVKKFGQRDRVITEISETKTRCVQSEARSADINNIVAKAYKTGQLPVLMGRQHIPDLPDVESYQDALNKVVFAQQQFERLPSAIRAEFANSPQNMLAAVEASSSNPELKSKLEKIGIFNPSSLAEQKGGGGEAAGGTPAPAAPAAEQSS